MAEEYTRRMNETASENVCDKNSLANIESKQRNTLSAATDINSEVEEKPLVRFDLPFCIATFLFYRVYLLLVV